MKPERHAIPTSVVVEGGEEEEVVARFLSSSYTPKRVVEYVICRRRDAESYFFNHT